MADERPTISALTSRAHVLKAIAEFDELGEQAFLSKYGYGPARSIFIEHEGRRYGQMAIAGVAWGLQHFGDGRERPNSYTGGAISTWPVLRRLGFRVVNRAEEEAAGNGVPPKLEPGRVYDWDELGALFEFEPSYLQSAGGMISRPAQNALLLITNQEEAGSFSYGDEWDGDELIYTGRGLSGHQRLSGQNKQLADNSRVTYLFEYAGKHELRFCGQVECVDDWESIGPGKDGRERRMLKFRLRPLRSQSAAGAAAPRTNRLPASGGRAVSSFRARPFDPGRRPSDRRRGKMPDPEAQRVRAEQADAAHQRTLSTFGQWLADRAWESLEEMDGAIDLIGQAPPEQGGRRAIFEIKSITLGTERTRVRAGLAQLLEYRLFLGEPKDALCLVSNRPISERRLRLLNHLGIAHAYVEGGQVAVSGIKASRDLLPGPNAR